MQGKIKWFSEEKGYGYIVGDDGKDYYFNVREVHGAELPGNGDVATFSPGQGKKGPRATSVVLTGKSQSNSQPNGGRRPDDRATCPHCGKKMIPRLITYRGSPEKSLCPFCGGVYKQFSSCFIATAVYGDYYAPEVIALRRFRDETLETSAPGRLFVKLYYRFSPPVAAFLSHRRKLSAVVKVFLNVLARRNG
ncbi:MAG: cold shock domain-containing protein [Pseudomonadota bacterium]